MRDPGQMRERILIEAPTTTRDATGGQATTWAPIAHGGGTLWARKMTEKGLEAFSGSALLGFSGSALLGKAEVAFAIRYWPAHGLTQMHRFTFAGRVYNIASVVESEHRAELVLLGMSGANRG